MKQTTLVLGMAFAFTAANCDVTWGQEPPVVSDTQWLRTIIPLSGTDRGDAQLVVAASGNVTVYFNGQRLLKNEACGEHALSLNVSNLVRNGRNSVAIAHSGKDRALSVWISWPGKRQMPLENWKAAPAAPPVGWQQTDFNDRDWKAATAVAAQNATERPQRIVEWIPQTKETRVRDGGFEFLDGDHVLLIGGTFIERAQQYGHLECALNRNPDVAVTFRNLGWSADTVYAESRGIFDAPARGYERLIEHVRAEEPSVIILCYGQNEALSYPGKDGVTKFAEGLSTLCADLATTGAELVIVSPHPFVSTTPPLPDPTRWNERLSVFAGAAEKVAQIRGIHFVDLFTEFQNDLATSLSQSGQLIKLPSDDSETQSQTSALFRHLTDNGMHWNESGYRAISPMLAARLTGPTTESPEILVEPKTSRISADGCEVRNPKWNTSEDSLLELEYRPATLTPYTVRVRIPSDEKLYQLVWTPGDETGVPEMVSVALVADETGRYIQFQPTMDSTYETFRELTARKNELYFHRWRPQNITYLYGFRKHEQGNNASEIARFDPLVGELEQQIAKARQPVWHRISIRRVAR